jgi:hypothetical protein
MPLSHLPRVIHDFSQAIAEKTDQGRNQQYIGHADKYELTVIRDRVSIAGFGHTMRGGPRTGEIFEEVLVLNTRSSVISLLSRDLSDLLSTIVKEEHRKRKTRHLSHYILQPASIHTERQGSKGCSQNPNYLN